MSVPGEIAVTDFEKMGFYKKTSDRRGLAFSWCFVTFRQKINNNSKHKQGNMMQTPVEGFASYVPVFL